MSFDKRLNDLMSFKAKHGHCDVPHTDEYVSLARWSNEMRNAHKKIQLNQKPRVILSDENMQSLNNVGFKWTLQKRGSEGFDIHFNDLMAFNAEHGHCDVPWQTTEYNNIIWACGVEQ